MTTFSPSAVKSNQPKLEDAIRLLFEPPTTETWLGVTSLSAEVANLKRLLELKREHWGIENRLHWVRDVVFGEDKSTLHNTKEADCNYWLFYGIWR